MNGIRAFENADDTGRLMTDAVLELLPSIRTERTLGVRAIYDHFDIAESGLVTFPSEVCTEIALKVK